MPTPCEDESRLILERSLRALRGVPAAPEHAIAPRIVELLARHDVAGAQALLPRDAVNPPAVALAAAAARHAEQAWAAGELGFDQAVTVFAGLDHLLRPAAGPARGRCLLAVPDGDPHTLGAVIAGRMLTDGGLPTRVETGMSPDALLRLAAGMAPEAVGLSVGADHALAGLAETVEKLRLAVPGLRVILGGPAFTLPPDAYAFVGADLVTNDIAAAARAVGHGKRVN